MKKVKIYKGKHTVFLPGLANILKDNPLGLLWCGFYLGRHSDLGFSFYHSEDDCRKMHPDVEFVGEVEIDSINDVHFLASKILELVENKR